MSDAGALVLVVEDEPQMRKFIRASLRSHGYRVIEAERASEALMLITSQNPELVLLDLGLPDGDGIDVTKQVREWSAVPIVRAGLSPSCNCVVYKPPAAAVGRKFPFSSGLDAMVAI